MKNIILFVIFLIPFLIGCNNNVSKESEKYEFYSENNGKEIVVADEQGKDVIVIKFDETDSITSVHMENYKGLTLSVGRYDGELSYFIIGDESIMYHNLTQFNLTHKDVLIDRQESYRTFSKKYELLDKGQIRIQHWDYINEIWISEKEFEKQQTTRE